VHKQTQVQFLLVFWAIHKPKIKHSKNRKTVKLSFQLLLAV